MYKIYCIDKKHKTKLELKIFDTLQLAREYLSWIKTSGANSKKTKLVEKNKDTVDLLYIGDLAKKDVILSYTIVKE